MEEFVRTLIERMEALKCGNYDDLDRAYNDAIENCVSEVKQHAAEHNNGWIDVDLELPPDDKYILVSFSNFSLPAIARYEEDEEGGAFYLGDDDETLVSHDLFVNAWMPLPKKYTKGDDQ